MKTLGGQNYFVYIVTNKNKTVLYTGVTNNLQRRLYEHEENYVVHCIFSSYFLYSAQKLYVFPF